MKAGNRVGGTIIQEGAGTLALQAAIADRAIRVTSYVLSISGAGSVEFNSAATPITGDMGFAAASITPLASGYDPNGHFQTVKGEALNMILTGAVNVYGHWTGVLV